MFGQRPGGSRRPEHPVGRASGGGHLAHIEHAAVRWGSGQGPHLTSGGDNDHPNADRWILLEGLCRSMGSPVEPASVEHWYAELEEISTISEILILHNM